MDDPDYLRYIEKMKKLQTLRHGVIKRYFDKFKYKKNHRNEILQAAEASEDFLVEVLRDEYVHYLDGVPEIREFLEQVRRDELIKQDLAM